MCLLCLFLVSEKGLQYPLTKMLSTAAIPLYVSAVMCSSENVQHVLITHMTLAVKCGAKWKHAPKASQHYIICVELNS